MRSREVVARLITEAISTGSPLSTQQIERMRAALDAPDEELPTADDFIQLLEAARILRKEITTVLGVCVTTVRRALNQTGGRALQGPLELLIDVYLHDPSHLIRHIKKRLD